MGTLSGLVAASRTKLVALNQEIMHTRKEIGRRAQKMTEAPDEDERKLQKQERLKLEKRLKELLEVESNH